MRICLLILFQCAFLFAQAQKIKLKDHPVKVACINLPHEYLGDEVKTYSTVIANSDKTIWKLGLTKAEIENKYLQLKGYEKVEEGGDVVLHLELGQFTMKKEEMKEKLKSFKGGDTPKNKEYYYEFSYVMPAKLTLYEQDQVKTVISPSQMNRGQSFTSPDFDKASTAKKNYQRYRLKWINEHRLKTLKSRLQSFHNQLNDKHGFPSDTYAFDLQYPKLKKAPSYNDLQAEVEDVAEKLSRIQAYEPIDPDLSSEIHQILEAWKKEEKEVKPTNKHMERLQYAYLSNIMHVAYSLDDYETAGTYAGKLVESDYKEGKGRQMQKQLEKMHEEMEPTGLSSLHEPVGPVESDEDSMARGPSALEASREEKLEEEKREKMGLHENAREYPAKIEFTDGNSVQGSIVVDYSKESDIIFYHPANYQFFIEKDGEVQKRWYDMNKASHLDIGSRKFRIIQPKGLTITTGRELRVDVLEIIAESDVITVYKKHPSSRPDSGTINLTGNFWIQKSTDKKPIDLAGLKFLNFKKGMSKYLSDCPSLAMKAKSGMYSRNEGDLIRIVEEYTACMENK